MGIEDFHISSRRPADGVIVIQVSGKIDMTSSLAFEQSLFGVLDEGARHVVVDLGAAGYVDTTGMSVLWTLAKRCRCEDREVAIVCCDGWVRSALTNTGLDQMIATHATLDEALGHGGPAR